MAASGQAADSGLVQDGFTAVNNSLGNKQAKSTALTTMASLATAANNGKVITFDASGNPVATAPAAGTTVASTAYASTITN